MKKKKTEDNRRLPGSTPLFRKMSKQMLVRISSPLLKSAFPRTTHSTKSSTKTLSKSLTSACPILKSQSQDTTNTLKMKKTSKVKTLVATATLTHAPLETEDCQTDQVVYKATVTEHDQTVNTYTGLTRNTFKKHYNGHNYTFNHRDAPNSTTLSTHLWKLMDMNRNYDLKWNILDRAPDFNPVTRKCRLCLKEIFYIMFQPEGATLNKRSELYSTCRHRLRLLLNNT